MLSDRLKTRLATERPMTSITLRIPVDVVDSMKAIAPQLILQLAAICILEQDQAIGPCVPDPRQLGLPAGDPLDHPGEHVVGAGLGDVNAHVVALGDQPQVDRAELVVVADAEHPQRSRGAPAATHRARQAT